MLPVVPLCRSFNYSVVHLKQVHSIEKVGIRDVNRSLWSLCREKKEGEKSENTAGCMGLYFTHFSELVWIKMVFVPSWTCWTTENHFRDFIGTSFSK